MSGLRSGAQNAGQRFNRPAFNGQQQQQQQQQPMNANYRQNHNGRADADNQWREQRPAGHGNNNRGYPRGNYRDRAVPQNQRWPEFGETAQRKIATNLEGNLELQKLLAQMNIKRYIKYADKPPPGNAGRDILLLANYFKLKLDFKNTLIVHHYDVTFEVQDSLAASSSSVTPGPRRRSRKFDKRFNGRIIEKMFADYCGKDQIFNGVSHVYDFEKILYTNTQLKSSDETIRVEVKTKEFEQQKEDVYIVSLQHVTQIELNPNSHVFSLEAVQFIDVVLRYGPSRDRIPVGNEIFFRSPEKRVALHNKNKEVAFGFYQSARNSEAGLMLNVDRATSLFHIGDPLLAVFEKCIPNLKEMPRLDTRSIREMTKDLQGTRMKLVHLPQFIIRTNQFTDLAACEIKFTIEDKDRNGKIISKKNMNVAEYYKEKYNSKGLEFPNYPCVVTGNNNNPKYYPIELCELLPDQYVTKLLPPALQSKLVKETSKQKPNERFFGIFDSLEKCIVADGKRFLTEFGFSVNRNMVKLSGRVIPSPKLKYGDDVVFNDTYHGDWMMQKPEPKKFFNGVVINKWIIVELSVEEKWLSKSFVDDFQKILLNTAKQMGTAMSAPLSGEWNRHNFIDIETLKQEIFQKVLKKVPDLQLIMFIIPDVDECYYGTKKLADLDFGIATQCCNKKQGEKMLQVSYVSNLMLKINAKMNGVNWTLDVNWNKNKKIMFVGVDVTHPSPGNHTSVSIASVVGSYDDTLARYDTVLSVQEEMRCETVDLHLSIAKLLDSYTKHNNSLPDSIIIYRDGVSEGQFKQVMTFEVAKITDLLETLAKKPKVTYIVVQKRHNIRFLPANREDATKSLNVPVGTVVESIITDPSKFDFFICSQKGLMSTSIPSRYWVLFDENKFTADQIQEITFNMCFMYPSCTKSVSIPMPVELADLSAERARNHYEIAFEGDQIDLENVIDQDEIRRRKQLFVNRVNQLVTVNEKLSKRLYYL